MATLSRSSSASPGPQMRHPKSWAKRIERSCCSVVKYFPLAFVYGLTTWAVWVEARIGFLQKANGWIGSPYLNKPLSLVPFCSPSSRSYDFDDWGTPLYTPELVLHHCRLYRSWFYSDVEYELELLSTSDPGTALKSASSFSHGEVYRGGSIL